MQWKDKYYFFVISLLINSYEIQIHFPDRREFIKKKVDLIIPLACFTRETLLHYEASLIRCEEGRIIFIRRRCDQLSIVTDDGGQ